MVISFDAGSIEKSFEMIGSEPRKSFLPADSANRPAAGKDEDRCFSEPPDEWALVMAGSLARWLKALTECI
jgi:hypothetical protein